MTKRILFALIVILCSEIKAFSQTFTDVTWSDLTAKHGGTIDSNDIVVVEPTDRLVLTPTCNAAINLNAKGILVYGELVFDDSDPQASDCALLTLTTDWILVAQNAAFIAGTERQPLANNFQLVLSGAEADEFDLSAVRNRTQNHISTGIATGTEIESGTPSATEFENMIGDNNYSFLMAMGSNAKIIMHSGDAVDKKTWVQLDGTANPGDDVLHFDQETGWEAGDKIAIASTDFDWNQAEDFTIVNVEDNGRTVFIDNPLQYMHYGEIETYANNTRSWDLDMRAEVGLLTRNITIRGDINYDASKPLNSQDNQFGGHVMAMMGAGLFISGVEFEHMGQAGKVGRYPAHWHMLVDASGQYIKNSSFHHTFNKGMTIHGTLNTLVQDNMVYENIGHSYFFEDGSETGNQIIDNLAINARRPRTNDEATPNSSDFTNTSNFWVENAENTFIGNHAAGSEKRGFHFALKGMNGESVSRRYQDSFTPSREGPKEFIGNAAHSTERAFFLGHGNLINNNSYQGTDDAPQIVDESWNINDFTAYKAERGTYIRGIGGDLNEVKMGEMADGTAYRFNQSLNNSLIVGRTSNTGTPVTSEEIAQGRSLPKGNYYIGHQLYDGPGGLNNVHFAGFTENGDYAIRETNAEHKSTLHYVNNITFGPEISHSNKFRVARAILESKGLVDIDGSLTGTPGATLVGRLNNKGDDLLYTAPGYEIDYDWNVVINRPGYDVGSFKFQGDFYSSTKKADSTLVNGTVVENDGEISTRVIISREDGEETHDFSPGHTVRDQSLFVTNTHQYKISLVNAPPTFRLYINDLPMGEGIIYEIEGLNANFTDFTLDDEDNTQLPTVSSMADLETASRSSVFRNRIEDRVYVKFVAQMRHGFSYPQPRMTFEDKQYGGVKVNVTLLSEPVSTSEPLSTTDDLFDTDAVSIYPNPVTSTFKINLKDHPHVSGSSVQIISTLGEALLKFDLKQNHNYDISGLKNGLYFIVLKTAGKSIYSGKIVKRD